MTKLCVFNYYYIISMLIMTYTFILECHQTRPCETSQFVDMKKPPRFGKRFQSANTAKHMSMPDTNRIMLTGEHKLFRRSPIESYQLLCIWPSKHRRNPLPNFATRFSDRDKEWQYLHPTY